jgi:hypothetical protein
MELSEEPVDALLGDSPPELGELKELGLTELGLAED